MAPADLSTKVKAFAPPSTGSSGLYIYRSLGIGLGAGLKKDIWVDSRCIGESAPDLFFYTEVKGNTEHKLSTESEFSPNDLHLRTESGKHYFVKQYVKPGVFVGGAGLEVVPEAEGKATMPNWIWPRAECAANEPLGLGQAKVFSG
jgi:hypothetical protein